MLAGALGRQKGVCAQMYVSAAVSTLYVNIAGHTLRSRLTARDSAHVCRPLPQKGKNSKFAKGVIMLNPNGNGCVIKRNPESTAAYGELQFTLDERLGPWHPSGHAPGTQHQLTYTSCKGATIPMHQLATATTLRMQISQGVEVSSWPWQAVGSGQPPGRRLAT